MSDIQKQVENRVGQLDTSNQLRDFTAAQAIIRAKESGQKSITMANYESLGYRERIGKPTPEKIAQLDRIFQQVKSEWSSIQNETKKDLNIFQKLTLKKTTQNDLNDIRKSNRDLSQTEKTQVNNEAAKSLNTETGMLKLNNDLMDAWTADFRGGLFDGGLIGAITKPRSHLKKVFDTLTPEMQKNVLAQLAKNDVMLSHVKAAASGNAVSLKFLGGFFGRKNEQFIVDTFRDPKYHNQISHRLNAIGSVLLVGAISTALGAPSVYLGKLKLPFTVQKIQAPGKDVAAYALYGMSASEIQDKATNDHARFTARMSEYKDAEIDTTQRAGINAVRGELDANVTEQEREAGRNLATEASWWQLGRKADARLLASRNRKDTEKYTVITEQAKNLKPGNYERVRDGILSKVFIDQITATYGYTRKLFQMMSTCGTAEEFLSKYNVPNENFAQYIRVFYQGGKGPDGFRYKPLDSAAVYWAVHHPTLTPGAIDMVKAYSSGKTYSTSKEGITNNIDRKGNKYAGNIEKILSDANAVANYIDSTSVNGENLRDTYSKQIFANTGVRLSGENIIDKIRYNSYDMPSLKGFNSGFDSKLGNINYNGRVRAIAFPGKNRDGKRGIQVIGIKGDCANLVVAQFIPFGPNFVENGVINVPLRIPLAIGLGGHGGNGGGSSPSSSAVSTQQGASNGFGAQGGGFVSGAASQYGGNLAGGVVPYSMWGF